MRTETPKRVADSRNAIKWDAPFEGRGKGDATLPVDQVSAPEVAASSCVVLWSDGREDFQICCPLCSGREDCRFRAYGSLFSQKIVIIVLFVNYGWE